MQPPAGLDDLFTQLHAIRRQLHSLTCQVDDFTVSFNDILINQKNACSCHLTPSHSSAIDVDYDLTNCSVPLDLTNYSTSSQSILVPEVTQNSDTDLKVRQLETPPKVIIIDEEGTDEESHLPVVSQPEPQVTFDGLSVPSKRASDKRVCKRAKKCRLDTAVGPTKPHQNNEEYSTNLEQIEQTSVSPVQFPSIDPGAEFDKPTYRSRFPDQRLSTEPNSPDSPKPASSRESPQQTSLLKCTLRYFEEHIKTISLDCQIPSCDKSFAEEEALFRHMHLTHKQKSFQCPAKDCPKLFSRRKLLRKHMNSHFSQLICRQCQDHFLTATDLLNHTKERHTRGQFVCIKEVNCSFVGSYRIDVIRHIQTDHQKANFSVTKLKIIEMKCPQETCDKRFSAKEMDRYYEHMFHRHGINPNRCLVMNCGRSYPTEQDLTSHISTRHANLTYWQCNHCTHKESAYSYLKRHIFNFHYEGLFKCSKENCDFMARFRTTVISHFNQEH